MAWDRASDDEHARSLIGEIYDAALDPSLWSAVLAKTRDFVGGSAAVLVSKDATSKDTNVYYECGSTDRHYRQLYRNGYNKLDPSTAAHVMAGIGQSVATTDVLDFDEFERTRFFQEWRRPQGLVDFVVAPVDKSGTSAALLGVFRERHHGLADEGACRRLRQIAPHVRRAMLVARAIELKTAEATTFAETLDGLRAGMFLVDAVGRVVHTNVSGRALVAEGAALRPADGRLMPTDADAARALAEIYAVAGCGDAACGVRGIAVPLTGRDGERYVGHVLPLTSGARRQSGSGHGAVAAVFVRKAALDAPSPPEIIARHYGLTPTELRVLLAIVEVGSVRETAESLGIGEGTVKTHLHRLYGKTGATRQADLVKLVAGFASPLLG